MKEFQGHPDQHFGSVSYAQHGDDFMLLNIFKLLGIENPSYLDLGAHHPFIISNTALLYERGSRGVNIEANPNLYQNFVLFRPEDTNVNIGVGLKDGLSPFYMYSDTSGRNTFSQEESKSVPGMTIKKVIDLPIITINQVKDLYCDGVWPDLLTTDIEGLDYSVLESMHMDENHPRVICTETRINDGEKIKALLKDRNYFCYCRMGENLFFVHEAFRSKVF